MKNEEENQLDPEKYNLESLEDNGDKENQTSEETEDYLTDAEESLPDANKFVDDEE
jgi:hypothetical protein